MYNHLLDTFIAVADCGSFTKAAGKLFISPTAVMKQMNALEAELQAAGLPAKIVGEIIPKTEQEITVKY